MLLFLLSNEKKKQEKNTALARCLHSSAAVIINKIFKFKSENLSASSFLFYRY